MRTVTAISPLGLATAREAAWGSGLLAVLFPRQGRRFERLLRDAELRYLKGLGHVPMSDDPKLLAGAIEAFARRGRVAAAS